MPRPALDWVIADVNEVHCRLTDDLLRLLVWIVADATLVDHRKYDGEKSVKRRVQFKLSRPEKIRGLCELLDRLKMPYTCKPCKRTGVNVLEPWYIRIYGDSSRLLFGLLEDVKEFPWWFTEMDAKQFGIVLETLGHTDATVRGLKLYWNTTSENDMKVVKWLSNGHGHSFEVSPLEHGSGFKHDCKLQYQVKVSLSSSRVANAKAAA